MGGAAVFTAWTLASAIVNGIALIFAFSGFGTLLFRTLVAPPAFARLEESLRARAEQRTFRLAVWSLGLAVVAELSWLVVESGVLAGAGLIALLAAIPVVARQTEFGHLVLAQAALFAAAFFLLVRTHRGARPALATTLSGLGVVLETWHLHAAAMHSGLSFFLVCEAFHVVAAAAWLGSLLPLALFVRAAPPGVGVIAALRYSTFAKPMVLVLAITAAWQSLVLIGGFSAFATTSYGWLALAKIALFGILIVFAVRHRFRMVPALAERKRSLIRSRLEWSIFGETAFGIAIVLVAAVLASLAPPTMAAMTMS